jgi:hypothetical protein
MTYLKRLPLCEGKATFRKQQSELFAALLEALDQERLEYQESLNANRLRPASLGGPFGSSVHILPVPCVTSPATKVRQAIVPVPPKPLSKAHSPATPARVLEGRDESHKPCFRIRVMSFIKEVWFTA